MAPLFLFIVFSGLTIAARNTEIKEICSDLSCDSNSNISVCGIRNDGTAVRLKLFENECALLRYGCSVEDEMRDAYGLIGMEYCERLLVKETNKSSTVVNPVSVINEEINKETQLSDVKKLNLTNSSLIKQTDTETNKDKCKNVCDDSVTDQVCGIKTDGNGYRVRLFKNKCELITSNCANDEYVQTDKFICESTFGDADSNYSGSTAVHTKTDDLKNDINALKSSNSLIVINGAMLGRTNNLNETIDNFFAATHVLDLPLKKMDAKEMETRRVLLKNAAAIKVFTPWIVIPKVIKTDYYHQPTLSSCYHKCPTVCQNRCVPSRSIMCTITLKCDKVASIGKTYFPVQVFKLPDPLLGPKCPETYAPVCGVPGIRAREPSIMFQNHCFMDVAQCKMFWENKSVTAVSSSYIESSFLFCLGDQLNGLYRFLPLIRTLQHMGRLKRKGKFRYKLQNLRWFNNLALNEPRLMG